MLTRRQLDAAEIAVPRGVSRVSKNISIFFLFQTQDASLFKRHCQMTEAPSNYIMFRLFLKHTENSSYT